jgi:hypothetical protein
MGRLSSAHVFAGRKAALQANWPLPVINKTILNNTRTFIATTPSYSQHTTDYTQ